jgi:hypothetical protein
MTTRNHITSDQTLNELETHLAGTLKRVAPPNDLVQRLRLQVRIPAREEIVLRLRDWRTLFVVFGGVMSGLLLIITIARAFYYLIGRRGVV